MCGWTQKELAEHLEIDQSHYAKLENGKRNWQTGHIHELCKLYNINEDDLLYNKTYEPEYDGIEMFCKIRENKTMKPAEKRIHVSRETSARLEILRQELEKQYKETLTIDDVIEYLIAISTTQAEE